MDRSGWGGLADRDDGAHRRPRAEAAFNVESAAEIGRALAHRIQAEMPGKGGSGIESDAVVLDLQPNLGVDLSQHDANLRRSRVPAGIVQRLLRDSVKGLLALPACHGFRGE